MLTVDSHRCPHQYQHVCSVPCMYFFVIADLFAFGANETASCCCCEWAPGCICMQCFVSVCIWVVRHCAKHLALVIFQVHHYMCCYADVHVLCAFAPSALLMHACKVQLCVSHLATVHTCARSIAGAALLLSVPVYCSIVCRILLMCVPVCVCAARRTPQCD